MDEAEPDGLLILSPASSISSRRSFLGFLAEFRPTAWKYVPLVIIAHGQDVITAKYADAIVSPLPMKPTFPG